MQATYQELINLRSDEDLILHASPNYGPGEGLDPVVYSYTLQVTTKDGTRRESHIDIDHPDWDRFCSDVLPLANKTVFSKEKRFKTPNYVDRSTWNGKSTGDHVIWYVALQTGSVHPLNGTPVYIRDPEDSKTWLSIAAVTDLTNGNLQAARAYPIDATYDDINYKWLDSSQDRICYFDEVTNQWKADNGDVICKFDVGLDSWVIQDTEAAWVVKVFDDLGIETSRMRINPNPGYKIVFSETIMRAEQSVTFANTLHYRGFGYATTAQGAPFNGVFYSREDDFKYAGLEDFRATVNVSEAANSDGIVSMKLDYIKTQLLVLDSLDKQFVDIWVENDGKMSNTALAQATFIVLKKRSFR